MIDVLQLVNGKKKQAANGWWSFNAVCCPFNGESQDKRQRGGLKINPDGGFSYHCFNCNFKASFTLGRNLSFKARKLLQWMGADPVAIEAMNLESLKHRSIHGMAQANREEVKPVEFEERELDPEAVPLQDIPEHEVYVSYLRNRCVDPFAYPYLVTPNATGRNQQRVIIPFTHNNKIVGCTSRYMDNKTPKYINEMPKGFVFGTDLQRKNWQYAILVEGVFDAIAIQGLAVLHNDINTSQAQIIKSLNKTIIVVPDQDQAGMALVDKAIDYGWAVSMPEWPKGVKDVNDAVVALGKLGALASIMFAKETSKVKIELRKRQIAKRIST